MPRLAEPCQPGPRAARRPARRGIRPVRAPRLHPTPRVAGRKAGSEASLASRMGQSAAATIRHQGEVNPGVGKLKAPGLWPIETAAAGLRRLAVREPCEVLPDQDQRHAPRGHGHGVPLGGIALGQELIIIARANLGTPVHLTVAVGKGAMPSRRRRLRNGGRVCGRQAIAPRLTPSRHHRAPHGELRTRVRIPHSEASADVPNSVSVGPVCKCKLGFTWASRSKKPERAGASS
jgi:hypothetical protein